MSDAELERLYRWWWTHDAHWYQAVARRFGFDAANEMNKEALKFVAERVGRSVARRLGKPTEELNLREAVEAFGDCCSLMWPETFIQFDHVITGPDSFEFNIRRNFALEMLRRAGTLENYECPCLPLREGWFKGLGLKHEVNERVQCVLDGCDFCTLRASLPGCARAGEDEGGGAEGDGDGGVPV